MTTDVKPPPIPAKVRSPRRSWPLLALAGILSVLAAVAIGELIGGLLGPSASPFRAVADAAVRLTPGSLKDFAVANFGTNDKLMLKVFMGVVMGILAIIAGIASRRNRLPGMVFIAVFGALGVFAITAEPDIGPLAVVGGFASMVAGLSIFNLLHRLYLRTADESAEEGSVNGGMNRRTFSIAAGAVAGGSLIAGAGGIAIGALNNVEADRTQVGALVPKTVAPPIPANAAFESAGTPTFLTTPAKFYRVDTALTVPQVKLADWTLKIHGMVQKEVTFNFADLRKRDLVERTITLTCVSNQVCGPYISTTNWIGIPLRDLLNEAGVRPGADQVFSTSVDGYTAGSPTEAIMDPNRGAMLAIGMNRQPLPAEHGFPARLVVPGLYGYLSATKWVTDIELTTFAAKKGYWVPRGYSMKAPIKTESRIDNPTAFQSVPGGKVTVSGIAWAQPKGIKDVQVRVDAGPWEQAQLAAEVNDSTWRMWKTELNLKSGQHTVESRAQDKTGYWQTMDTVDALPNGATGWPSIVFSVA